MSTLPKHILDSIEAGTTSLHNSPILEPKQIKSFFIRELSNGFDKLSEIDNNKNIVGDYAKKLNDCLTKCKEIENTCLPSLSSIAQNVVLNKIFRNRLSDVELVLNINNELGECEVVREYDPKTEYNFKDLGELDDITKEIQKRRFLNVLISGFACYYSNIVDLYLVDIFNTDKRLPELYSDINVYNSKLLYLCDDLTAHGIVDTSKVILSNNTGGTKIEVSGYTFQSLLYEAIRGVLEYCISKNYTTDIDKFKYIIDRTDHCVFDVWDMRLGLPIVNKIISVCQEEGIDLIEVGLDRFIEVLCEVNTDLLFNLFKELLSNTSKGKRLVVDILRFLNSMK